MTPFCIPRDTRAVLCIQDALRVNPQGRRRKNECMNGHVAQSGSASDISSQDGDGLEGEMFVGRGGAPASQIPPRPPGKAKCAVPTLKPSFLRNHTFHSVVPLSRQAGAQRGTRLASNELGKRGQISIQIVICVFWVCTVDKFSTSSDSVPHLSRLYGPSGNGIITSWFPISSLAATLAPIKDTSMPFIKTTWEALGRCSSDVPPAPPTVVPRLPRWSQAHRRF